MLLSPQPKRFVLSFVPKTVKIPPTVALTYNVTLLNSTGKPIYSHRYDTVDGVLDLELVPTHKSLSKNATYTLCYVGTRLYRTISY